jgi:transcriptional regulator with XRE-family HTH domain
VSTRADSAQADGQQIVRARHNRGWTRKELSEESGVSLSTLKRAEQGKFIRANILAEIAEALGVKIETILSDGSKRATAPEAGSAVSLTHRALCRWTLSFDAHIADRTSGFIGRTFVFAAIDSFVRGADSGYFMICGVPGIGKTALISQFIRDHDVRVHHFNIATDGITTPQQALGNICARLILEFDLPHSSLPDHFAESGAFLSSLLHELSSRISRSRPLMIAIDALDEVNPLLVPPGANHLFLPSSLPDNVYVILTARTNSPVRLDASRVELFQLQSTSRDNKADIVAYIEPWLERGFTSEWIRCRCPSRDHAIATLVGMSEGNFMYLRYVLPAIARGEFAETSLESLPRGLLDYYRRHWETMRRRAPQAFETLYRPVLCVYAALSEAWPIADVSRITKLPMADVSRVINEWLEFFHTVPQPADEPRYRLYHSTFAEYLSREVDPGLETYHRLIADSLLEQAGPQ